MHDRVAFIGGSKRKKKVYERTNDGFRLVKSDSLFNTQFHTFFYYFEKDTHTHLKLNPQWFSRNSKKWKKAIPDFYELENYASCFFMGYLYVFGGFLTDRKFKFSTDVCYVYDPKGGKFDEIATCFSTGTATLARFTGEASWSPEGWKAR